MIRLFALDKAITAVLLVIALVIAVVVIIGEGMIHRNPAVQPAVSEPLMLPPTPAEPAALAVLEAFFVAPDLVGKAKFVRDTARVKPLMLDYHDRRGHSFPTLGRVSPGKLASFDGTPMVLFEVEPFSGPRYPVAVVWDGRRFAVDWESLTAYGTMDWSEFLESKPTSPQTLRVYLRRASDAEKIPGLATGAATFIAGHRDDPQSIPAIAEATVAGMLESVVGNQQTPVTLEVAWRPLGIGGIPEIEILRLIALKWSP